MRKHIDNYRQLLTNYDSLLAYSLLGVLGGVASGLVILAFEKAIVLVATLWAVGNDGEDFESLPLELRFLLPALAALALGVVYRLLRPEDRETGIVHVLSRMHSHYGALPVRNALVQFFGGAFALGSGLSGGREGPGVHLGSAVNSLIGQRLVLPNNSLRVLIACGTAGGIAAAFNTPLAGVIFAMEVIVAEYTVAGFIPVMLAAVSASAVSRTFAGGGAAFVLPELQLVSLAEIPYIVFLGFVCGLAVVAFIHIARFTARFANIDVTLRFTVVGVITGLLAMGVPQIMGIGYDTLNLALQGQVAVALLLLIAAAKIVATAISAGVGMPVGIIGPNLLIGACLGGALGHLGQQFMPELASHPMLYILIGMGAAMGAVMSAPLAALLAVIELTHSIEIGMPAMLAIVAANLTSAGLFRQRALHQAILRQLQRVVPDDPLNQLLHRTHVGSIMDTRVVRVPSQLSEEDRVLLLESSPTWCLVTREGEDLYLIEGSALLAWLQQQDAEQVDITDADIRRWTMTNVPMQANLRQAWDSISKQTVEAACVFGRSRTASKPILHGVVTRESIEKFTLARL
ncbi:chloride channel protein [Pseudohalioglobus sediminis]|uniref:Chloride channel protein n=1 Tax=Pseudohalioglobus sediminis TaxID=2606449 RepID=A0A5B0WYK0_9GAMM|nr:chloride channel protein [Pseudohalioglobus sediminis]KAA1192066.1 chloride channel protein [Pseudohalioglobus sediminis]